jgi:hypothetical protein
MCIENSFAFRWRDRTADVFTFGGQVNDTTEPRLLPQKGGSSFLADGERWAGDGRCRMSAVAKA